MKKNYTAADERNFRSSYYEKVGCHSVEEKKSLSKLLSDNIRNHAKLKQFCLSFIVPEVHRRLLWNIILGVLPLHKDSTDYIMEQRTAVYEDLLRAVNVIKPTSNSKAEKFYTMWLLENNRLLHPGTTGSHNDELFVEIVKVLIQLFDSDVETYWIAKEFFMSTKDIQKDCLKLKEITQALLRDDIVIYNHLDRLGIFSTNKGLLDKWYATCFAGVISESALVKIWDKICGGSRKILIFVFLELVKSFREPILNQCNTQKDFKNVIEQVKEQDAAIVNKAIKTWQSNKNHSEITVHL